MILIEYFFKFETNTWKKIFTFHHKPSNTSSKSFQLFMTRINIHRKVMKNTTSFSSKNLSLSDITLDEYIVK